MATESIGVTWPPGKGFKLSEFAKTCRKGDRAISLSNGQLFWWCSRNGRGVFARKERGRFRLINAAGQDIS